MKLYLPYTGTEKPGFLHLQYVRCCELVDMQSFGMFPQEYGVASEQKCSFKSFKHIFYDSYFGHNNCNMTFSYRPIPFFPVTFTPTFTEFLQYCQVYSWQCLYCKVNIFSVLQPFTWSERYCPQPFWQRDMRTPNRMNFGKIHFFKVKFLNDLQVVVFSSFYYF